MSYSFHKKITLINYFIFFYGAVVFSFIKNGLFAQYDPLFFNYNRDLSELFVIATGIPRFMISHPATFLIVDVLTLTLPIIQIAYFLKHKRFSLIAGACFTIFLFVYFLLRNIFFQSHLEPFVGYWLLSFIFLTNDEEKFYAILKFCRYAFIYIFFSAAVWKIARGTIFNYHQLSNILLFQHKEMLNNNCQGLYCTIYRYLINHPPVSYTVYLLAVVTQGFFIVGFFTRKFDTLLLVLAITFFAFDHLLMQIFYWAILVSGITLLIKQPVQRQKSVEINSENLKFAK